MPGTEIASSVYADILDSSPAGNVSSVDGSLKVHNSSLTDDSVYLFSPHYHNVKGSVHSDDGLSFGVSVAALRQAYAAQKYKEIQLANDVDFASQIEAHFGVKPKHADDISYFIGGSSSMIDINPIVNQNLSGDGQANYKASPIGNGSSKIKFTADTYGVLS